MSSDSESSGLPESKTGSGDANAPPEAGAAADPAKSARASSRPGRPPAAKTSKAAAGSDGTAAKGSKRGARRGAKSNPEPAAQSAAKPAPEPKTNGRPAAVVASASTGPSASPEEAERPGTPEQNESSAAPPAEPAQTSDSPPPGQDNGGAETGDGGGGPDDHEQNGGEPPAGGPSLWRRLGTYALAGAVGGLIVAIILLLTTGWGDLRGRLDALQAQVNDIGLARGAPEQVAAMRKRVDALGGRIDALANLSGSDPLVRQLSDLNNSVIKLRGLVEKFETGAGVPGAGGRAAALRADLEQINGELTRLDTKLAELAGKSARDEARLTGRLEALEAVTPNDLPKLLDRAADKQTVNALVNRVARLERDEINSNVRSAALALALANLTRAVQTSQPFLNELKAIRALEPDNAAVAALEPYAKSGLPSVPTLAGRFDKVADNVVTAYRRAHGKGILGRLWDGILGLFRVRPVGEAAGTAAPAIVARAEQRLADGDLYLATEELSKLGAPEKAAAAKWLGVARSRLELDNLFAQLSRTVLEEIAAAEAARKARQETAPAPVPPAPAQPAPAKPGTAEPPASEPAPARDGDAAPERKNDAGSGASEG